MEKRGRTSQGIMCMLMVQVFATGMQLLAKIVLSNGTFVFALMAYRHIVAALCVAPFAFLTERISLPMSLFNYGLRDTTAAYAVNFLNLIPIVTFFLSIIMRMEKVKLGSKEGKMKSVGAMLCVGGAFTSCFYKGESFFIFHKYHSHHLNIIHQTTHSLRGTLALTGSCFCYALWYILQVKLTKVFPFKYWATMLTCIIASIQSTIIGLILDTSKAAWQLKWNLQLLTILYSGVFGTAATFCMIVWAVAKWGPTYPSMFNPITLVFVALLDGLILGSPINLGNLVGMILIIVGLYSFLFGRRMEMKSTESIMDHVAPNAPNVELWVKMKPTQSIDNMAPKSNIK